VEALLSAIRTGGPAPVAFEEYVYTTLATFAIEESLRAGEPAEIDAEALLHRGDTENAENRDDY
jgi:hypothetical protein